MQIQEGDFCDKVSVYFGITVKILYFLNPEIDSQCSNLLLDVAYCVKPVGSIESYPGWSTSHFFTLTSTSYVTSTAATDVVVPGQPTPTPTPDLPRAPGTLQNCTTYRNWIALSPVVDQAAMPVLDGDFVFSNFSNSCKYLAGAYGVAVDSLIEWNPSLSSLATDACAMQQGFSYCVSMAGDDDPTVPGKFASHHLGILSSAFDFDFAPRDTRETK